MKNLEFSQIVVTKKSSDSFITCVHYKWFTWIKYSFKRVMWLMIDEE